MKAHLVRTKVRTFTMLSLNGEANGKEVKIKMVGYLGDFSNYQTCSTFGILRW